MIDRAPTAGFNHRTLRVAEEGKEELHLQISSEKEGKKGFQEFFGAVSLGKTEASAVRWTLTDA